ncbi:glucose-6-phosphate dehydrogenase [Neomicrococcus lactis]|uniref:glucose-6-phosphate dehydrogenase n=1 Tax=Neomicrococcus lactis TaxID=732241 RepID=UPI002300C8DD|nr:glucose-6-phosphate dehydrogenase [Neomicrococcus lactis]
MSTQNSDTTIKSLLILGASGDLTQRLLLPGLASLLATGKVDQLHVKGVGTPDVSAAEFSKRVAKAFAESIEATASDVARSTGHKVLSETQAAASYETADVTAPGELGKLVSSVPGPVAVFFALPPAVTEKALVAAAPEDLPEGTVLVLEKPFGSNLEAAKALNQKLTRLVPEQNIHRVDHFLGKSTVLNILGLRFANRFLEPLMTADHVESVHLIYDEELALEGRAGYYDKAGALRDMIQSHLLQIMALIAIDPPATLGERDLRDKISEVLRATNVAGPPTENTRRARYSAGTSLDRSIVGYAEEEGVDPARNTETLAEVTFNIINARWNRVPFVLRSGKAMERVRKEAIVTFKPVSHLPTGFTGCDSPTKLRIGFGPDTLALEIDVNGPGDPFHLDRMTLSAKLNQAGMLPYGEVLLGVLSGEPTLSVRADAAEECWRIVEPVLAAWEANEVTLEEYPAGSEGPTDWVTYEKASLTGTTKPLTEGGSA